MNENDSEPIEVDVDTGVDYKGEGNSGTGIGISIPVSVTEELDKAIPRMEAPNIKTPGVKYLDVDVDLELDT